MHHGVYCGRLAADQNKRILILGESHHINNEDDPIDGIPATYTTGSVVEEYLLNPDKPSLRFFSKIADSFGFDSDSEDARRRFWEKVYFGNYVDVLCGIGDNAAKGNIKANRVLYNDELFHFINKNSIDIVFCFGRKPFNALPSLADKSEAQGKIFEDIYVGEKQDYIALCTYKPHIFHKWTTVELESPVAVYSLRHPSSRGGYIASNYVQILSSVWNDCMG